MGLFDFVKEIGHKLFNRDEEAAEKIKKHIEDPNPGIEGLSVEYKNGTVFLSGQAASPEAMEKAVLMAGNVKGVSEVNIDGLQAPPVQAKVEYYIIKKGDTLSAIAKQFYGKANDYPRIFEANREVIKDANLIFPGQKIRIPLDVIVLTRRVGMPHAPSGRHAAELEGATHLRERKDDKMNISDLLGAMMQSGMSPSSGDRMKNALGGGGGGSLLESLSGMLGGQSQQGGGLGSILTQALGGGSGSGGLGGILGNVLNDAGNAVGGKQNLALGGLGALAGALLGGGGKSVGGALGGGVMALLGAMAYQALKGGGSQQPEVPAGAPGTAVRGRAAAAGAEFRDRAESHDQCRQGGRTDRPRRNAAHRGQAAGKRDGQGGPAVRPDRNDEALGHPGPDCSGQGPAGARGADLRGLPAGDRGGHPGREEISRPTGGRAGP